MSLLAGIITSNASTVTTLEHDIDTAMSDEALVEVINAQTSLDLVGSRLSNLLNVSEVLDAVELDTKSSRQLGRLMVANALVDLDLDTASAVQATAGLESEHANVGNEAFETIKGYVKSIIEWIQKKWKELKRFIAKYWNKYFGDVERLAKAWAKLKQKVEKASDLQLDKSAKAEFTKGADYFHLNGTVATPEVMIDQVKAASTLATIISTTFSKEEIPEFTPETIVNEKNLNNIDVPLKRFMLENLKVVTKTVHDDAPAKYRPDNVVSRTSAPMLGNRAIYHTSHSAYSLSDNLTVLNAYTLEFGDLKENQKPKDNVSIAPMDTATINRMIDANIELIERVIDIKRSKTNDKLEDSIDKATKSLGNWMKQAPSETDGADKRALYRKGLAVARAAITAHRKAFVDFPRAFCGYAKTVSQMQKVYCEKSLSAHKKAD